MCDDISCSYWLSCVAGRHFITRVSGLCYTTTRLAKGGQYLTVEYTVMLLCVGLVFLNRNPSLIPQPTIPAKDSYRFLTKISYMPHNTTILRSQNAERILQKITFGSD